jgi:hypothetical protein
MPSLLDMDVSTITVITIMLFGRVTQILLFTISLQLEILKLERKSAHLMEGLTIGNLLKQLYNGKIILSKFTTKSW